MPIDQLSLIYPELFVAVSAMLLLLVGVYRPAHGFMGITFLAIVVLALAATIISRQTVLGGNGGVFGGLFAVSLFTQAMKMLVLLGTALVLVMVTSHRTAQGIDRGFEFPVVILFSVLGLMLMISANNLIALYLGLELASLSQYILAAYNRDNTRSSEAGLKYFILGSLASGMLLFGSSLVYGFSGTVAFSDLQVLFTRGSYDPVLPGVVVGMVFVIVGLCFKVSAAPFHMWTPDVYEGAPTPVTAFFAIAPKIAGLALFTRVLSESFGGLVAQWQQVMIVVAVLSMTVGALGAIVQRNIKRLLAYSSIGHVGYALIGLAAANEAGITGIVIYLALYLVMSVGAFACVMRMTRGGEPVEEIVQLAGVSKSQPWLAFTLMVLMLSMAGIPPLAGFFGKMYVFLAAMKAGLFPLAVIGVLTSVIAAFYYLKIIKIMYFDEPAAAFDADTPLGIRSVQAAALALTLGYFIHPTPLIAWAIEASQSLRL